MITRPPSSGKYTPVTIVLKGGQEHTVSLEDYRQYLEDFPRIDVLGELRKMRSWCQNNPSRRKTPRGIGKFISAWLSRAKEDAPQRGSFAASHRPFEPGIPKTSEDEKRRAEADLARLQALIDARTGR
jgi:hypothetical protein